MQHNDEKPQNTQELKGGTCRRSRKVQEGRDFICGCGKKYLSYPALYTHIKTKHQGKMPQGTDKTGSKAPIKKNKLKQEQEFIKIQVGSLEKKDLTILNYIENCEGFVPLSSRVRKQDFPKQLYQHFSQHFSRGQNLAVQLPTTPEAALLAFLINTGEFVCEKVYTLFVYFAKIIRNVYMEHGQQIYQTVFKERVSNCSTFSSNSCQYLPIIIDFVVRFYVDMQHPQIDNQLLAIFFFDLSQWMKIHNLTCLDIKYKKQIKKTFSINSWRSLLKNNKKKESSLQEGEPQKQSHIKSDEASDQNEQQNNKQRQQSQSEQNNEINVKLDEHQVDSQQNQQEKDNQENEQHQQQLSKRQKISNNNGSN